MPVKRTTRTRKSTASAPKKLHKESDSDDEEPCCSEGYQRCVASTRKYLKKKFQSAVSETFIQMPIEEQHW